MLDLEAKELRDCPPVFKGEIAAQGFFKSCNLSTGTSNEDVINVDEQ
jgi:hypothetical protein